ncbi:MAG: valine--pyruvate transaminase [Chloroflexi bacterium]|nr:MAG: valine--pyruvate transaminase [Chloroflexota bacterium]
MKLSSFGQKFTSQSGILQLMDDLGSALAGDEPVLMLGGGNPAHIAELQTAFRRQVEKILAAPGEFERWVGNYAPPQGSPDLRQALAGLLRQEYGWPVSAENIALTHGSQSAFFLLFNMFAGPYPDGSRKKILLPLAPEYIGYEDVGLTGDFFTANRPQFEFLDEQTFKYHVDFDALSVGDNIGAICVSRPTNPTGNVLTNQELRRLVDLAQAHDIPLIIDNAYGLPFPSIVFTEAEPVWDENVILCMSLSKLGLPSVRTGIVIAPEPVIQAISAMNAITSLAPGGLGAGLVADLIRSGEIIRLSREVIRPYYRRKAEQAAAQLRQELAGLPCYIHKPEGAFFLWLWFKDLPITTLTLYQRLKQRRVLVVPGEYFFPGLPGDWRHKHECIRVSYAQSDPVVQEGLHIIAGEVKRAYDEA